MKTYTYFVWCPTGAHKKCVVFQCVAKSITEADSLAKQAGVNFMKHQVCWQ